MYQSPPSPWGSELYPILHIAAESDVVLLFMLLSQKLRPENTKNALPVKKRAHFPRHVFRAGGLGALTLLSSSVFVCGCDRSEDPHRNDNVPTRAAGKRAP